MYQLMITIGIVIAFLSNTWLASYATFGGVTGGHWRIMLGMIAIPAAIMFVGVLFLPESPRWLFLKGFKDRAVAVFERMHLDEAEIAEQVKEIEDNLKVKQNGFEMFKTNPNFRRVIGLGIGLQIIQQLTGINVVMYFAPTIFKHCGVRDHESANVGNGDRRSNQRACDLHRHRVCRQTGSQADHVCRFCHYGRRP